MNEFILERLRRISKCSGPVAFQDREGLGCES